MEIGSGSTCFFGAVSVRNAIRIPILGSGISTIYGLSMCISTWVYFYLSRRESDSSIRDLVNHSLTLSLTHALTHSLTH